MRRMTVVLSVVAVLLLGGWAVTVQPGVIAQDATPAGDEFELPEGITFEPLGYGIAETLPAAPGDFILFRFGIEPGVTFDFEANDPSVSLAYVESGSATFNFDAPATILRAAAEGTPFPEATEDVTAGTDFTLEVGDSVVVPPNVTGGVRNDGDEPVSLLVASIAPLPEGMAEGESAEGTPTS